MKKVFSLILALAMILALAVPTMAAGTIATNLHEHTITISSREGYEFEAYQVFYGDLDDKGTLSNIEWGSGVDGSALLAELKEKYPSVYGSGVNDAEDVATILAKDISTDNQTAMDFADIAAKHIIKANAFTETSTHVIDVEGDGYYLIINTKVPADDPATPENEAENVRYSRHMLEVVRDVSVSHKGSFPTVKKEIVEGSAKVSINEASIGDVIDYEVTGTLPTNLSDYDAYFYRFRDTLSKGLTYNADAKIYVGGYDVTQYFYKYASEYSETAGTSLRFSIKDIKALELIEDVDPAADGNQTIDLVGGLNGTTIILKYSATLNENAVIAVAGNPNVVDLEYSNNPNDDGEPADNPPPPPTEEPKPTEPTGVTPKHEVNTYTTKLAIQKTDGTGASLTGAQFHLTGSGVNVMIIEGDYYKQVEEGKGSWYLLTDGTYTDKAPVYDNPETPDKDEDTAHGYAELTPNYELVHEVVVEGLGENAVDVEAFVDADGKLVFTGLGAGDYILTETVTPKGFNTIDPIEFTVTFNVEQKMFRSNNTAVHVSYDENTGYTYNSLYTTVVNHAGSTLPSTGGIGTTLFYVFGGLLFVGAAVLLVTKKRMAC